MKMNGKGVWLVPDFCPDKHALYCSNNKSLRIYFPISSEA